MSIAFNPSVFHTAAGTPYLREPGLVLIAWPQVDLSRVRTFLAGFDSQLGFEDYLADPDKLLDAEALIKFAGQLCYLSLTPGKFTPNAEAHKYFTNLKAQGHGSVLEHASFSWLVYGIDRAVTHELVRHRAGMAYSQLSQRYADGAALRFVERAEYQADEVLHNRFMAWIDAARAEYDARAARLMEQQAAGQAILQGEKKRDLRKKVNQAARSCLPNETEAPIVVSTNVRALRHVIEMRADAPADIAIRALAYRMYEMALEKLPNILSDYTVQALPDGVPAVVTPYRKV